MIGALLLGLLWSPAALAVEYRAFTLSDGRTFVAEVVSTEATGMRVRTRPGETFVPFADLIDMVPVDESVFAAQEDMYVYVASDAAYRGGFEAPFRGLSGVKVLGDHDGVLSDEERRAAAMCGTDLECAVRALDDNAHWMWVVVGRFEGPDAVFEGALTKGPARTRATAPRSGVDAVNTAAWQAIQIAPSAEPEPEPEPVPEPRPPKERTPMTAQRALGLAFVPVPGLPNAMAGDWTGFGIGMAVVVPATAVWVGATGKSSQSAAGHVLLGLGGFYAATVVTNQVLAATRLRDPDVVVGVGPTEHGGAAVQITVAR